MATHTNLSSLFTAIADAIRAKTGGTEKIVADNFPVEIAAISTGTSNTITVTAPTGSIITASNGSETKTATENNGTWVFSDLTAGTWTITATKDNLTVKAIATVVDDQSIEITYASDTFSDNDWATIISACQSGVVPDAWVVGDSKTMTINGTAYTIDIIDKNHDEYADGSGTAPLTFQLHELYDTTYQMNGTATNGDGYGSSAMHTTHLPAIKALMPSEVQAAIKPVSKLTSEGSASSTIVSVICDLFLLSEIEIFGSVTHSKSGEGRQYAYYSAGNSKVKYKSGTATYWWERSPRGSDSTGFCRVFTDGTANGYAANSSFGVSFCFCF